MIWFLAKVKTIDDLIKYYGKPSRLSFWLWHNVKYRFEGVKPYGWQVADTTLQIKEADCKAFAVLTKAVLTPGGYNCHILCLYRDGKKGHAVCTIQGIGYMNVHTLEQGNWTNDQIAARCGYDRWEIWG